MKELRIFDKRNYDRSLPKHTREASRAIIIRNNKIVMVRSQKQGYYKFPGGGNEEGETHLDTLIRETSEETGLTLDPESVREFGLVRELRKDIYCNTIFEQISYYYFADIREREEAALWESFEAEAGFSAEFVDVRHALETDKRISDMRRSRSEFLKRETFVLELLLREQLLSNSRNTEI